jgi:hypothetical protein
VRPHPHSLPHDHKAIEFLDGVLSKLMVPESNDGEGSFANLAKVSLYPLDTSFKIVEKVRDACI